MAQNGSVFLFAQRSAAVCAFFFPFSLFTPPPEKSGGRNVAI